MSILLQIILATLAISVISLLGVITLSLHDAKVKNFLIVLVGLSTGALMGGAFLHLLPEAQELAENSDVNIFLWVLIAFVVFFIVEKILHWRHCHKEGCSVHTFGTMNLIGDAVHNFIDGLIIAAAFLVNTDLGLATMLAVALHEIPQEIGDYAVLLHAGYNKTKALIYNFLSAVVAVVGGIAGYYLINNIDSLKLYLLPFAAGGFIYIAASDLLPELRKETNTKKILASFGFFILGIILMFLFKD